MSHLGVDTVEKVFWGWRTKFSRAADTFRVQRCEGPRPFSEKRPRTAVLALLRASTASVSKSQHLRDFWRRTIFDFFNSICQQRTHAMHNQARAVYFSRSNTVRPKLVLPGNSALGPGTVSIKSLSPSILK